MHGAGLLFTRGRGCGRSGEIQRQQGERGCNDEIIMTATRLLCDRGPARAVGLAHRGTVYVVLPKLRTPVLARARGLLLRDGNWARHHAETVRG
jgi:hypothetical protein